MRVGIEHWRRERECTSGTLYWQLNDCWPVASWSSIDYYGRWKALHYAARRFYSPVLLSAEDDGERVRLAVTNDSVAPWRGRVEWSLETLTGQAIERGSETVLAPPLSATSICALDLSGMVTDSNRRAVVLVYELWQDENRLSLGVVPFAPSKHLRLGDPGLTVEVSEAEAGYEIDLMAEQLARFVWLELPGSDVVFGDNYFDLPAGRRMIVALPAIGGWSAEDVAKALRVRSLIDSF